MKERAYGLLDAAEETFFFSGFPRPAGLRAMWGFSAKVAESSPKSVPSTRGDHCRTLCLLVCMLGLHRGVCCAGVPLGSPSVFKPTVCRVFSWATVWYVHVKLQL